MDFIHKETLPQLCSVRVGTLTVASQLFHARHTRSNTPRHTHSPTPMTLPSSLNTRPHTLLHPPTRIHYHIGTLDSFKQNENPPPPQKKKKHTHNNHALDPATQVTAHFHTQQNTQTFHEHGQHTTSFLK